MNSPYFVTFSKKDDKDMGTIFPNIDRVKIEEFHKKVGQNVKKYRMKKGMSQLELSIFIGHKSPSFISNCENYKNKEHFNLEHLFLISDVLDVNMALLIE
jgi:ribosome-binding protein aMBF1 (putative translation factor)